MPMDAVPVDLLWSSLDSLKLRFQAANDPGSLSKAWLVHVHDKGEERPAIYGLADGFDSSCEKPSPSDLAYRHDPAIGRRVPRFRRCVRLNGYQRLKPICDDAGRLLDGLPNAVQSRLWGGLPDGTQLMGEGLSRWMLAVFELGNANVEWSSLRCKREYPASSIEEIRMIFTGEKQLPADAEWFATLPDFAAASVQAIDILQNWLADVPKQAPENSGKPDASKSNGAGEQDDKPEGMPTGELRNLMENVIFSMGENELTTAIKKKGCRFIAFAMKPKQKDNSQLRKVLRQLRLPPYELLSPPSGHGYFLNSKGVAVYEQLKKDRLEKSLKKKKSH